MRNAKALLCVWIFLLGSLSMLSAQSAIRGIVVDDQSEPQIGAVVNLCGTTLICVTNNEGEFEFSNPPKQESFTLQVQLLGFKTAEISDVKPSAIPLRILLEVDATLMEEVSVTALQRVNSEVGVTQEIKGSKMVVSGISARTIAKTHDRDAGEAVRRIPGVSLIDNKFIIARGLARRYNNVWINNTSVPSSEADSRAFSFDLIPAGQIENILIIKSPIPELPADFTGGFIKIQTKDSPEEAPFGLSYSLGVNTATQGKPFLFQSGSATDLLGFDNGKRSFKGGMTAPYDNNNATQVTQMTRNGFNNDWTIHQRHPLPDQKFAFVFGKSFTLPKSQMLTVNGALNYSYTSQSYTDMENSRYGVYNKVEDQPEYLYKYTDNQYITTAKIGALLNIAYLRAHSRYYFRNLFNQIGQDKLTLRSGWQNISSLYNQQKTEYNYTSRSTYSGQFAGSHDATRDRFDWAVSYAYADKNQPDRRIINRQENDLWGDVHYGEMGIDQNSIERNFIKLKEHTLSAGGNYTHTFSQTLELKSGLYAEYRTRTYRNRAFFYRFNTERLPADFPYGDVVNDILIPANYGSELLYLYDDTDNRDNYDGCNTLAAAYLAVNLPLGAWNIYAGARFEYARMNLTRFTRTNEWSRKVEPYTYRDLFPSINLTYTLRKDHLLRAAYGISINRPEFREVSPSVYYDFDLFSDVKGNPDLKAAYIQNADLRYEWYPSAGEVLSFAVFYKHFRNPIETTFLDAGGSYTYTFENADRANVYGIELELRKNLRFLGLPRFDVTFNGSLIQSEVQFPEGSMEHNRPLQGQSPYLINAGLFYQTASRSFTVGLLYNRIGKRIVGIGKIDTSIGGSIDNDIPDMYEMPHHTLDLVLGKTIGKAWELKLNLKDILAKDMVFCQFPQYTTLDGRVETRRQVTKRFNAGCNISLTANVKF